MIIVIQGFAWVYSHFSSFSNKTAIMGICVSTERLSGSLNSLAGNIIAAHQLGGKILDSLIQRKKWLSSDLATSYSLYVRLTNDTSLSEIVKLLQQHRFLVKSNNNLNPNTLLLLFLAGPYRLCNGIFITEKTFDKAGSLVSSL